VRTRAPVTDCRSACKKCCSALCTRNACAPGRAVGTGSYVLPTLKLKPMPEPEEPETDIGLGLIPEMLR
jgi:hypothetical protein